MADKEKKNSSIVFLSESLIHAVFADACGVEMERFMFVLLLLSPYVLPLGGDDASVVIYVQFGFRIRAIVLKLCIKITIKKKKSDMGIKLELAT